MAKNIERIEKYLVDFLEIRFIDNVKGYGVFTNKFIPKNTIIEKSYCIKTHIPQSFENYIFKDDYENYVLPLGFGCVYNHSKTPNIKRYNESKEFMIFESLKDIEPHEELLHNYGRKI
jgi:SET domain-containing protein